MTRREAIETERMLERLEDLLQQHVSGDSGNCRPDAESLRRISMTLHRWHELECGIDGGCIERGYLQRKHPSVRVAEGDRYTFESDEAGAPYWADHNGERTRYHKIPDREAGALKRLAAIMARYPSLASYVQGDPRGCALYILRPGDVPAGESPDAYYSRGLAVHQ